MGTDVEVIVVDGDRAVLGLARRRLAALEASWSRFRTGSDVSSSNRCAGSPVTVAPDTITLFEHALAAAQATGGRYDPTIGQALLNHGYDRDFVDIARSARTRVPTPDVNGAWPAIEIDRDRGTVCLPEGMVFDPGGIGKGLAADLVANALAHRAAGLLVNLGGDLRARGEAPTADGWVVSIEDPFAPDQELLRLSIPEGAIATSSRLKRRWDTAEGPAHHIIDPTTGRPVDTDVVTVTVVAGDAWWAEAQATSLFLQGPAGLATCERAEALIITDDGRIHATAGLAGIVPLQASRR